ncbi:MAG: type II secretion system protein [Akkermansiaceae bacterium]|nr:type II secretion system protein [Akkermansiaceae bacterium]
MNIPTRKPKGFTLVELLVVIAILIVLASLVFSVGTRMLKKSKATVMATNMKQMGTFFTAYASDNQELMMPCRGDLVLLDGSVDPDALWHEIILSMNEENTDPAVFKTEDYWKNNDSFMRNPLFTDADGFDPLNPGYGYNLMLPENYELSAGSAVPASADIERVRVPMAFIDQPSRTPIVAPAENYYYRYTEAEIDDFDSKPLSNFLSEGSIPVLFLDGSVERIRPQQYVSRELDQMPRGGE